MKFAINLIFLYNRKGDSMSNSNKTAKEALHYYKDRTGQKYGRLLVIKYLYTNKRKKAVWLCKCECGKYIEVPSDNLAIGNTKSCGCLKHEIAINHYSNLNKQHRMKGTKIYSKWLWMKARCYKEHTHGYKNYGGRGIKVCDEWLHNFKNFYDWAINNGYSDDLTIERIDTNGDYEPSNCKWITNLEQQNNKRNNRFIEYKGEKHTIAEWSRITGINKNTILDRLNNNWDTAEILGIKQHKKRSVVNV